MCLYTQPLILLTILYELKETLIFHREYHNRCQRCTFENSIFLYHINVYITTFFKIKGKIFWMQIKVFFV